MRLLAEGAAELPLAEGVDQRALVGGDLETNSNDWGVQERKKGRKVSVEMMTCMYCPKNKNNVYLPRGGGGAPRAGGGGGAPVGIGGGPEVGGGGRPGEREWCVRENKVSYRR